MKDTNDLCNEVTSLIEENTQKCHRLAECTQKWNEQIEKITNDLKKLKRGAIIDLSLLITILMVAIIIINSK